MAHRTGRQAPGKRPGAVQQRSASLQHGSGTPLVLDGTPVPGVLVSTQAPVALFQFQFTVPSTSLTDDQGSAVLSVVEDAERGTGLRVLPSDSLKAIEIPVGAAEVVGLAVAAVVLVLTRVSLVAAGLPLITALVGVGVAIEQRAGGH